MKRILAVILMFFVLAFVGYANAQTAWKGNLLFTVNITDEVQKPSGGLKLVSSSQTFKGHLVFYLDMEADEPLVPGPNGYSIEIWDLANEVIVGINTVATIGTDIHNGAYDKVKIVGTGVEYSPDTALWGLAYIVLNGTIYYNTTDDLTKYVTRLVIDSGKVGGCTAEDHTFSGTLNVTTLKSNHPD